MNITAVIVSVNYAPELIQCLTHCRRHIDDVLVVTTPEDTDTQRTAWSFGCCTHQTDAFYRDPESPFAKDAATVDALKSLGKCGWTLLMDADILMPETVEWPDLNQRCLYSARRRMCRGLNYARDWSQYPYQRDIVFAGYFQLFHSDDPNLEPWPNYPVTKPVWYSDTIFQDMWPPAQKKLLPFDVLHIGDPPRLNWLGRSDEARDKLQAMLRQPHNFLWRSKWV